MEGSKNQKSMRTIARSDERILSSDVFDREVGAQASSSLRPQLGTFEEPARKIPVYRECDVLVIGGGPSGTAAAVAAAREGADVILLERYNHLGGLSTGGLVIWIDRMSDWAGDLVIQGFAKEVFDRLPPDAIAGPDASDWGSNDAAKAAHWAQRTAAYHGVVTWSPTIDPERLKLLSQQMVIEAGVRLVYHSWASLPILENGKVCGATFESKEGRMAIRAKVVIDATGDGDIFSRAGAASENDIEENDVHHCMNTAWLFGGVDMNRWIAFKVGQPEAFSEFLVKGRAQCGLFDRPFVSWRNEVALFMGPRQSGYSGLDVDDLSTVEVRSHEAMEKMLDFYRQHGPGFEEAFLMLSAPQIGVRHSRRLKGVEAVLRARWSEGVALATEIGVSPAVSPKFPNISIPYGALVPEKLNGLLACGRHVSCDRNSHGFMREIPQCWVTGQAAGAAAALAVSSGKEVRDINVGLLQLKLLEQGAFLRQTVTAAF
jgi:2-polyprenyl-6-methoxyphenol hydroxylase-like FAD-dependent oxidoreductase